MAPTIKEVAERARVSVSTVSRVLNDYPFVSAAARERVTDAMQALDYRPDMAARSMRTGTTRAVGFVVSDITNPVFAAVAKGADAVLHPYGYSLVLANSGGDPEHEAELVAALRQRRVDGLIAAVADERSPRAGRAACPRAGVRALRSRGAGIGRGRRLLGPRDGNAAGSRPPRRIGPCARRHDCGPGGSARAAAPASPRTGASLRSSVSTATAGSS